MPLTQFDLFSENDLLPCFGKTSLECCLPKTMLSDASWLLSLAATFPQRPKQEDGRMQVFLPDPNVSPHGESWTLNTSDSRNGAEECSLSQVLLGGGLIPQKYYLSARACLGILTQAKRRGKTLPASLKAALEHTVQIMQRVL